MSATLLMLGHPLEAAPPSSTTLSERAALNAELACGGDRRCRLNRLKERTRDRRWRRAHSQDQRAEELLGLVKPRATSLLPRYRRPLGGDISLVNSTSAGALGTGALIRYNMDEQWQLGLGGALISGYQSSTLGERLLDLELNNATLFKAELVYLLRKGEWSPLGGLSVSRLQGEAYLYDSQPPVDPGILGAAANLLGNLVDIPLPTSGPVQAQGELEGHLMGLMVGLDYQSLRNGAHGRLSLSRHYTLFGGHRDSGDKSNLPTRASAPEAISELLSWTIEIMIGWSL